MGEGLLNALRATSGQPIRVRLGESIHAGFWSGKRAIFSRARRDYQCYCGQHVIRKGEVYMTLVPDRMASWAGDRFRRRLSVDHLRWPVVVLDGQGREVFRAPGLPTE